MIKILLAHLAFAASLAYASESQNQIKLVLQSYNKIDEAVFHNNKYADVSTMERQIFDATVSGVCKMHIDSQSSGIGYSRLDGDQCPVLWINEKHLATWNSQELVGTFNMHYEILGAKFQTLNDVDGYEFAIDVQKKVIAGNSLGGEMSFSRSKKGFVHSQAFGKIEVEQLDSILISDGPRQPTLWKGKKVVTMKFPTSTEQFNIKFDGLTERYELNGTAIEDKELKILLKYF